MGAIASAAMRTLRRWLSAVIASPRRNKAFPPSAMTTSIESISQRRNQDRFDAVHAVLRLLEGDIAPRFEDLVGHLDTILQAERLRDLLADFCLGVVKGRQAVHELHLRVAARLE